MKPSTLMKIAHDVAEDSKCLAHQVGVVISMEGRIIVTGINGTPRGMPNCDEVTKDMGTDEGRAAHHEWSKRNEIHAEMNAILFAAKHGVKIDGATMYTTMTPCADCAKAIAQSGIKEVVYAKKYWRNEEDWADILHQSGVTVTQQE